MSTFKNLFGQDATQIKKNCILTPFLTKGLVKEFGVEDFKKGYPYASGNAANLTLIHTQIGAPYLGDAVLYLQDTPCENLIFLGACGLIQNPAAEKSLQIGSLASPSHSYELESFSRVLRDQYAECDVARADESFLKEFQARLCEADIPVGASATFGSLKLEEKYLDYLRKENINVVDMECSAFFNAAKHIKRRAVALFYITDILQEQHVYTLLDQQQQKLVNDGIKKAVQILLEFTADLE